MKQDKDVIGLTLENQQILDQVMDLGFFSQGQDAARFCMAYAVREGVEPGETEGVETRWAAGNFDKSGEIQALMRALYPEIDTPNRLIEHFVNEGLQTIGASVAQGTVDLLDVLQGPHKPK